MPTDERPSSLGRIKLVEWRPLIKGTLRGFASVHVHPPGLTINDIHVHRNGERLYAPSPGKPQIDADGRVLLDDRGKRKYTPIVEMPDDEARRRFSDAVVMAVQREHRGDLT